MTAGAGWYSLTELLSYGRPLSMVVGPRSIGKSVSTAIWCLTRYLRYGERFLYVRRTKDTLELTAPDWFTSAVQILHDGGWGDIAFDYDKKHYYIGGDECGQALPLNAQQKYKGSDFSRFFWLVFDEFIAFDGERYLGSASNPMAEYRALISLFQTMDRGIGVPYRNKVRIICLGNAETFYTPIFMGCGADRYLRTDSHFVAPKGKPWVVQLARREDSVASAEFEASWGYQLSDERTRAYAYENRPKEATELFIEKRIVPMTPLAVLTWEGMSMTLCSDPARGDLYVRRGDKSGVQHFALTHNDHRPAYELAQGGNFIIHMMKDNYVKGRLFFETARIKYAIDNFMKFTV